jgi:hypothetical protein
VVGAGGRIDDGEGGAADGRIGGGVSMSKLVEGSAERKGWETGVTHRVAELKATTSVRLFQKAISVNRPTSGIKEGESCLAQRRERPCANADMAAKQTIDHTFLLMFGAGA